MFFKNNLKKGQSSTAGNGQTCVASSCNKTGYTGTSICVCAAGYFGTASGTGSTATGCNQCAANQWSISGNGNTCYNVACSSLGYTGTSGSCTCVAGYYGTVSYSSGSTTGCLKCQDNQWSTAGPSNSCYLIPCNTVGYVGNAGLCTCAAGYYGSVIYTGESTTGCSQCAFNKWSSAGNSQTCSLISCPSTGYTGSDGACTCSAGYTG